MDVEKLVIRPSAKKAELAEFMQDFESGTALHPTSRHLRVWGNKAAFEVSIFNGVIRLSYIGTTSLGKGHGTRALRWLLELADKHGVEMRGTIHRVGREGLSERELRLWYVRHGVKNEKKNIVYQGKQTANAT